MYSNILIGTEQDGLEQAGWESQNLQQVVKPKEEGGGGEGGVGGGGGGEWNPNLNLRYYQWSLLMVSYDYYWYNWVETEPLLKGLKEAYCAST